MEKDKQFIKDILNIRDYWLGLNKSTTETINGFIHSLLVMFDGDSGINDLHQIELIDLETNTVINDKYPLHELLYGVMHENKDTYNN